MGTRHQLPHQVYGVLGLGKRNHFPWGRSPYPVLPEEPVSHICSEFFPPEAALCKIAFAFIGTLLNPGWVE